MEGPGGGPSVARQTFRSRDRLRTKAEFDRAYRDGYRVSGPLLLLVARANDQGRARLGLSVPRRVGSSPARNRVKRQIREIFRRTGALRELPVDLVVNARPGAAEAGFEALAAELERGRRAIARRLQRC